MNPITSWISGVLGLPPLVWWNEGTTIAVSLGIALLASAAALAGERERPAQPARRQPEAVPSDADGNDQRLPNAA